LRLGVPITEELSLQPHYSIYSTTISIPNTTQKPYERLSNPIPFYTRDSAIGSRQRRAA